MAAIALPGDWTEQYKGSKLNLSGFKLSFSDEFNTLDVVPNNGTGKWFAPVHAPYGAATFMSPVGATNPFSVSDGKLTITMKQVDGVWQSGTMQTVNSAGQGFAQEYGYFEMRAAFHGGAGAWPAFWMLSPDQTVPRVEVDIVEAYGGDPDGHHQAVHLSNKESQASKGNYTGLAGSMFDGAFHTYGARITTDWITVYYDGTELSRFPMSEFFRTPLYMVASLAMNPLEVERASGTYDLVIDYVRAYAAPDVMEQHLTGKDAADILNVGSFDDVLDGGAGADKMSGGFGNDTYRVDNAFDVVIEAAGGGHDRVWTSVSYALSAGSEIELLATTNASATTAINLTGNAFAQTIQGNAGANVINGGGGADTMSGYGGNDTYYVDNAGDRVYEAVGGGTDKVLASVSHALLAGSQIELLATTNASGTTAINLTGNEFAQSIQGNAGANIINGGGGADTMTGYGGNDTYYVDNAGDRVYEAVGGGNDKVLASVSHALLAGSQIELLATSNPSGTTAINLTGNAFAQTIQGNAGANVINGGGGADTMTGYGGNDTYYVDNAGDKVNEASGGGHDRVWTSVSYALSAGSEIELLATTNASATTAINLTGNAFAQTIQGNAGANVINGGGGADTLTGFGGNDTFVFNNTLGSGNVDRITDFNSSQDKIHLDDGIFKGLPVGALSPAAFYAGTAAHDSSDHIIYNSATGALSFDSDGIGGTAQTQFATLFPPSLSAASFYVT
ncbi:family 16 glycosylhydrolase [Mesorhizobium sp. M0768]|uniref:family 16 glycosylhydrolase n=1 Tax=Mesorhizobium sp. M0768 TaxID=2956996 RepID=UPI00333BE2DC